MADANVAQNTTTDIGKLRGAADGGSAGNPGETWFIESVGESTPRGDKGSVVYPTAVVGKTGEAADGGDAGKGDSTIAASSNNEKLPFSTKMLLALGESCQGIYVTIAGFYLNSYLLEVCCLDPASVGFIQLVQGTFDAFNDPLIGHKSDKCRTRWGRRRPWLLFGGPIYAVFYFGLWNALPSHFGEAEKVAYYMLCYMGVSIGVTCIQVQISSLTPELTTDYDERTIVSAYRLVAVLVGGLACVMTHAGILAAIDDTALGYRVSGFIFALVILICSWTVFCGIKERFVDGQESSQKFDTFQELRTMMQNRAFFYVIVIYVCGPTAVVLVQTNILLLCKYALGNADFITVIMLCVQGTSLISAPLWVLVSKKFGKRQIYFLGGPVLIVALTNILFAEGELVAGITATAIGSCLAVVYLAPYSMLPDVLELDELRTGKRREGLYSGFFTISTKLSTTIAMTVTNAALKAAGYSSPQTTCSADGSETGLPDSQPAEVVSTIRWLAGPIPASLVLVALLCSWRFPITRSSHSQSAEMAKQRRAENLKKKANEDGSSDEQDSKIASVDKEVGA